MGQGDFFLFFPDLDGSTLTGLTSYSFLQNAWTQIDLSELGETEWDFDPLFLFHPSLHHA
jgi:hypothetical protein